MISFISTEFSIFVQAYAIGAPPFKPTIWLAFTFGIVVSTFYLVYMYWIPAVTLNETVLRVRDEAFVEDQFLAAVGPYFRRKCKFVSLCGQILSSSSLYTLMASGGAALVASSFPYILEQVRNSNKDWCNDIDNVAYHNGPCVYNTTTAAPAGQPA